MNDAATEKFAALLRELKQRSGRSYGSLAARLHVSTSTLHRYCNGDAVPASYAPAERLARLCGATPEELVELHRRWHRAHGTRRGATPSWATGEEAPPGGGRTRPRPGGRAPGAGARGEPAAGAGGTGPPGRPPGARGAAARGAAAGADAPGARGGSSAGGAARASGDGGRGGGAGHDDSAEVAGVADAAVRGAGAGAGAPGSGGPDPGGLPRSGDPTGPGDPTRSDRRPGPGDRPGPDDLARSDRRTGIAGLTGSGRTADPGSPTASSDPAASSDPTAPTDPRVPVGQATSATAARPRAGARGLRRRMRVPAVGVAAAALVALVATSSGSTGEGKGRAAGGEGPESAALTGGSRGGGGAEGGRTAEPGGSAEPSERRRPSPAGGAGTGRDAEPGAAPGKGGAVDAAPAAPAARTPLAWSVRSHVWESGCDHRYVLDKSPDDVPPPPIAQDAEAWATSQGAVHGGRTNIEAAIEPHGDQQVTITAVHVRKTATGTPLAWNAFAMSEGCGGEVTEASYSVDLDIPRPVLTPRNGSDSTETWEPSALPYRVTPDDPLSLLIHANTEDHDVRWYLEVEWSSGDDSGVVRIDDRGAPFRTSAIKDRPVYGYDTLNGSWYPYGRTDDTASDPASEPASPTP